MKKNYILIICSILFSTAALAQIPQDFKAFYKFTQGSNANEAGGAMPFDGSGGISLIPDRFSVNDNAIIPNSIKYDGYRLPASGANPGNQFTVAGWFKNDGLPAPRRLIQQFDSNGVGFRLDRDGSIFQLSVQYANRGAVSVQESLVIQNVWRHFAVTMNFTGTEYVVSFYIDGALVNNTGVNLVSSSNTQFHTVPPILSINPTRVWDTALDDIIAYDRALSPSEITALYTASNQTTANTIYVSPSGSGNGSGDSWANASTLQNALSNVNNGDEMWVKEGVYSPGVNRTNQFQITTSNITIYGGFNGTESQLSERDIKVNETIFSGDVNNNDNGTIGDNTLRAENNYRILVVAGNDCTIDGITFVGGQANGASSLNSGAAIYKQTSVLNMNVYNCTFERNLAYSAGAAIFAACETSGSLTLEQNIFKENHAGGGAGVYVVTLRGTPRIELTIVDNLFVNNRSGVVSSSQPGYSGSSLWLRSFSSGSTLTSTIVNNTFVQNLDETVVNNSTIGNSTVALDETSGSTLITLAENNIFSGNLNANGTIAEEMRTSQNNASIGSAYAGNSRGEAVFSNIPNRFGRLTDEDPLFVDEANGDFRLSANSPLIDGGGTTYITINPFDLDLNNRTQGNNIDMGAYEFGGTASVSQEALLDLKIYPNPVKNVLNVSGDFAFAKANIYNLQGQYIMSGISRKLEVSELSSGLYFIEVTTMDGSKTTKQFLKR